MAHRFNRVARRLQKHWGVTYSTALRACIDTYGAPGFSERLDKHKEGTPGAHFKDVLFAFCVEDWEFD